MRPTKRRRRLDSGSGTEISTWVRDRENLREISRCAHLERKEVTCGRSNPDHTPADHPWLSQGWSKAKRREKWALVREKIAVRPRPPLRTRAGEATQRGLFVVGRREAPLEASTRGAEAGHPIVASGGETMRKLIRSGTDVIGTGEILHWRRSRVSAAVSTICRILLGRPVTSHLLRAGVLVLKLLRD